MVVMTHPFFAINRLVKFGTRQPKIIKQSYHHFTDKATPV